MITANKTLIVSNNLKCFIIYCVFVFRFQSISSYQSRIEIEIKCLLIFRNKNVLFEMNENEIASLF